MIVINSWLVLSLSLHETLVMRRGRKWILRSVALIKINRFLRICAIGDVKSE